MFQFARLRADLSLPNARAIALSSFIGSLGYGIFATVIPIYFIKTVHVPSARVGLGISIATLAWLPLAVPCGLMVDQLGARRVAQLASGGSAAGLLYATVATNELQFFICIVILTACESGGNVARSALIGTAVDPANRIVLSARLRSIFNLGVTAGLGVAGLSISIGSPFALRTAIVADATLALLCALVYRNVHERTRPVDRLARATPRPPLDLPFLLIALFCGALSIFDTVLTLGLPVWVAGSANVPHGLSAWLLVVNTVMVVLLQARLSGRSPSIRTARSMLTASAVLTLAGCAVLAGTRSIGAAPAIALLLVAVVLLSLAEIWGAAGSWTLRYALAPEDQHGRYGGIFGLASSVRGVVGPLLVLSLIGSFAGHAWLYLSAGFGVLALLVAPVVTLGAHGARMTSEVRSDLAV